MLNAFHCVRYSASCVSLKTSTIKAEYFPFCFGPEFSESLQAKLTLITGVIACVTPRSDLASNR